MKPTPKMPDGSRSFRSDINALRAIAFAAVLLYHFRVPGFSGGFVGVDIFLVISGYLMMSIISKQVDAHRFSSMEFYTRRISRVITPMIPIAISVCAIGFLILPPSNLENLAKNTVGMLTFMSNFMFWRESGYFNDVNNYNFLLHTWSLSLEVQFYLVFPLIFVAIHFFSSKRIGIIPQLIALIIITFGASIIVTQVKPIPAFYLLPTRLWQFLLGALVYEFSRSDTRIVDRRILCFSGLLLIAGSVYFLDSSVMWPGWLASLPSLGAALVIYGNLPLNWLYQSTIVNFLGKVSYSGYLWHWPIVAFLAVLGKIDDSIWQISGIFGTIILAYLSWRWIEQGIGRWLQSQPTSSQAAKIIVLVLMAAVLPAIAIYGNGIPARFSQDANRFFQTAEERPSPRICTIHIQEYCVIGNPSPNSLPSMAGIGAIVVGDSHAAMISQIVADSLPVENSRVLAFALAACPTIRGIRVSLDFQDSCRSSIDRLFSFLQANPSIPVVVANRYAFYLKGFNETARGNGPNYSPTRGTFSWSREYIDAMSQAYFKTLCEISNNRNLVLMYPFPEFSTSVPQRISLEMALTGDYVDESISLSEYQIRNVEVFAILDRVVRECGAIPVDPLPALCDENGCFGTRNRFILFTDSNHLTASGADLVLPPIRDAIDYVVTSAVVPNER